MAVFSTNKKEGLDMKTLLVCPKSRGNTFTVFSYIAKKMGADIKFLSQDKSLNLSEYDTIIFGSGVYGGRIHKLLSDFFSILSVNALHPHCKLYLFLTWFGRSNSNQDAFNYAYRLLAKRSLKLELNTFSCFGRGFGIVRKGHPNATELDASLSWAKEL
jgi:flavodoxin